MIRRLVYKLLASAGLALTLLGAAPAQSIDEVVLVVNDQAITANEYRSLALMQNIPGATDLRRPREGSSITEAVIDNALLISHIRQVAPNESISPSQLDAAVLTLARQNNLATEQFLTQIKSDGIDPDVFYDSVRNRLLIQDVLTQPMSARVNVSPSEVQEFIRNRPELKSQVKSEFELSYMLIPIEDDASKRDINAAIEKLEQAKQDIESGQAFERILAQTSGATSSTPNGYLGWKDSEGLPELFVSAVERLAPNQVSSVLETGNGVHLLKLINKRSSDQTVTEYLARHILKKPASGAQLAEVVEQMKGLRVEIVNGASFAAVAKRESVDGSAANGGQLDWVNPASLLPRFAQAMLQLPLNSVSQPVISRAGVHLIEVLDKRSTELEFSPIEARVREQLFGEKLTAELNDLISDLRSVAVIDIVE